MNDTKVHIEVVKTKKIHHNEEICKRVWAFIDSNPDQVSPNKTVDCTTIDELSDLVSSIAICECNKYTYSFSDVIFHIYALNERGEDVLDISDEESNVTTSNHWLLPNREFHGLYESLVYEDGVKENILKYVETILLFSKKAIDTNLISCNRLVLLHGPPGTGKTSLAKAIAQKMAIRFSNEYNYIHLIEINSHSLFSKWFSESGKLVMKLFAQIREIVEHKSSLVCILIDEIESIAFERNSISSNEPSDSLRVVNAVLTQLDQIRKFNNVLILSTSNLTSTIDLAFLDRADIKQYIGPPGVQAICKIYGSIIDELIRRQVIAPFAGSQAEFETELLKLAELSVGISGRTLRKIPIIAHAYFNTHFDPQELLIPMRTFLEALHKAIDKHKLDNAVMKRPPNLAN